MSVRNLTSEQYEDRMEWLMTASHELQQATEDGVSDQQLIDVLDRIKQAAAQCAKHRRSLIPPTRAKARVDLDPIGHTATLTITRGPRQWRSTIRGYIPAGSHDVAYRIPVDLLASAADSSGIVEVDTPTGLIMLMPGNSLELRTGLVSVSAA